MPGLVRDDPFCLNFVGVFSQTSPRSKLANLRTMPAGHPQWIPYREAHRLLDKPGAEALAATLRACMAHGYDPGKETDREFPFWNLPWPLAACLAMARTQRDLAGLAERAELGKLGDTPEWQAAEKRWAMQGVSISDLNADPSPGNPFDASIATVGFPIACFCLAVKHVSEWPSKALGSLLDQIETVRSLETRREMLWLMCFVAFRCSGAPESDFARLSAIVQACRPQSETEPLSRPD